MIPIEITEEQALIFRLLCEAGAWDIKSGSITIHFDSQGKPVKAEKREITTLSPPHSVQVLQIVV